MTIAVIYPNACSESAIELAKRLGAVAYNPYDTRQRVWHGVVINYGVSKHDVKATHYINGIASVKLCRDKLKTFKRLKEHDIPIPIFYTDKKDIGIRKGPIVARKILDGAKNDGLVFVEKHEELPDAPLYTEYFKHVAEYRVVVFMGKVVGRYHKQDNQQGTWDFQLMHKEGFEQIDEQCIKAAKVLGIDYVGFDVLENRVGKFCILEANSGPILFDEVAEAIQKYIVTKFK